MTPYLFRIIKSDRKSWLKFLMCKKAPWSTFSISDLVNGTSLTLNNTIRRELAELNIMGNSIQDGEPSPENPVPINSVGDNGSASIEKVNKNLLELQETTSQGISSVINTDGSLKISGTSSATWAHITKVTNKKLKPGDYIFSINKVLAYNIYISLRFADESYTNFQIAAGNTSKNITANKEIIRYEISISGLTVGSSIDDTIFIQFEEGLNGTTIIPHQSKTYIIPTQQPMRSIGEVRDDFVRQSGVWYERHKMPRVVLDGTEENWRLDMANIYYRLYIKINDKLDEGSGRKNNIICNYFRSSIINAYGICLTTTSNIYFYPEADITNISEWKAWLKEKYDEGNPVYVDYVAKKPILLPCTNEQSAILDEITTEPLYAEQTNFFSNDEVSPYLEVKYWKENI